MVDELKLSVELVKRRIPQWRFATMIGIPPSTLSDYLRGARPQPPELRSRIEAALNLRAGALRKAGR
jgi:predicted transcriptional regulator